MFWLIVSALGGAAAMYLLDPQNGNRRRATLRDQMNSLQTQIEQETEDLREQVEDRAHGAMREAESRLTNEVVDNETLAARVRAALGRISDDLSRMQLTAENGHVTLSGPILKRDEARLIAAAAAVPGVQRTTNQMTVYAKREDFPAETAAQ